MKDKYYKKVTSSDELAFKELVKRYADNMPICNCGEAYYHPIGCGSKCVGGEWTEHNDMDACYAGCSTNRILTKYYIARRVMADLDKL